MRCPESGHCDDNTTQASKGPFIGEWGRGGPEPWLRSREQSKFRANPQSIGWLAV